MQFPVLIRVLREPDAAGADGADRPRVPHDDAESALLLRRQSAGPGRHRQDRDDQGPREGFRPVLHRVQLFGHFGREHHGALLLGLLAVWLLVLSGRVQPHTNRSAVRNSAAVLVHNRGAEIERQ